MRIFGAGKTEAKASMEAKASIEAKASVEAKTSGDEMVTVICNKCKKAMKVEDNIVKEGLFEVEYRFGYFSKKDSEVHSFDLCEDCYDSITKDFLIPPEVSETSEIL